MQKSKEIDTITHTQSVEEDCVFCYQDWLYEAKISVPGYVDLEIKFCKDHKPERIEIKKRDGYPQITMDLENILKEKEKENDSNL